MRKALFLDRDGVINIDKRYLSRTADFEFVDGIFELARSALASGYLLFVVTNQSGIGRGYYTEGDFERLTRWMLEVFEDRGIHISAIYHCPYHPQAGEGEYKRESIDRKPGPGMILKARDAFDLDLENSILIGDKESDMEAARRAGIGRRVLLISSSSGTKLLAVEQFSSLHEIKSTLFTDH